MRLFSVIQGRGVNLEQRKPIYHIQLLAKTIRNCLQVVKLCEPIL